MFEAQIEYMPVMMAEVVAKAKKDGEWSPTGQAQFEQATAQQVSTMKMMMSQIQPMADSVFSNIDANSDGKVTVAELKNGLHAEVDRIICLPC